MQLRRLARQPTHRAGYKHINNGIRTRHRDVLGAGERYVQKVLQYVLVLLLKDAGVQVFNEEFSVDIQWYRRVIVQVLSTTHSMQESVHPQASHVGDFT